MPFQMIHGDLKDLDNEKATDSTTISIKDLAGALDTRSKIIQGEIVTKWPLQKRPNSCLLKVTIQQRNVGQAASKVHVYLFGELAEQAEQAQCGDVMMLSEFSIEPCTSQHSSLHPCQLIVEPDTSPPPHVWILRSTVVRDASGKQGSQAAGTSATASTSNDTSNAGNSYASPSKERHYDYTDLKKLKVNTTVNVYGVVKWFRPAAKSRGTDYMMSLSIIDSSLDKGEKLKCLLFTKEPQFLPQVQQTGEIVRLHRLKVKEFNNQLQGQTGPGFSCLVFDGDVDASMEPQTGHSLYTLTEGDQEKVRALREWLSTEGKDKLSQTMGEVVVNTPCSLASLQRGCYGNVVCQVVATCVLEPNVSVLLKVWDATRVTQSVLEVELTPEQLNETTADLELIQQAHGYIVDVQVFDDHFPQAAKVKPGDFILLNNLHAAPYKDLATGAVTQTIEFCLHHGTSYSRRLSILDPHTSRDVHRLRLLLNEIEAEKSMGVDSIEDLLLRSLHVGAKSPGVDPSPAARSPEKSSRKSPEKSPRRSPEKRPGKSTQKSPEKKSPETPSGRVLRPRKTTPAHGKSPDKGKSQSSNKRKSDEFQKQGGKVSKVSSAESQEQDRCLIVTATVTVGHHQHIPISSLEDVGKAAVPNKFRVRCFVNDYKPTTADNLIKAYCTRCHFLGSAPSASATEHRWWDDVDPCRIDHGLKYYRCPHCLQNDSQGAPVLEYTYVVQLLLHDKTGWLAANLWREQATTFFQDVSPDEALREESVLEGVMECLRDLHTPGSVTTRRSAKNMLEGCVKSYSTEHGTCYQIFDTAIAMND